MFFSKSFCIWIEKVNLHFGDYSYEWQIFTSFLSWPTCQKWPNRLFFATNSTVLKRWRFIIFLEAVPLHFLLIMKHCFLRFLNFFSLFLSIYFSIRFAKVLFHFIDFNDHFHPKIEIFAKFISSMICNLKLNL